MTNEYDVSRMKSSPMTNLLVWLTDEKIVTEDQAEALAKPLFLTLQNHYVKKSDIEKLLENK